MFYGVWLVIIYFYVRRFFVCGFFIGVDISVNGGLLVILLFGRVVIGLKFIYYFIKNCVLENVKLLYIVTNGRFGILKGDEVIF